MIKMLHTSSGYWDPLIWLLAFVVAILIVYIIRAFGRSDYKGGEQTKPFLSGMDAPDEDALHIRAGNIYWGFMQALEGYYDVLRKYHTGIVNDYVAWFVGVSVILFVIFFIVEVI
ncbi:MAG: hydrogenase [Thermoplasmata archaeon]|nr:hydrogenase [Thermoplasmata archaeon]